MNNKQNKFKSFLQIIRKAFSSIIFLLTLANSLIMVASAYSNRLSPVTFSAFPSYLAFLFPVFLLLNFCFFIYLAIRRKLSVLIPVLAFIISWPTINAVFPIHYKQKVPENALKFMTFNVQHFDLYAPHDSKEKNPIVQYILDHDADIVCLQEYGYLYIDGKPEVHEEFKKKYPYCKTNDIVNVNNYKYHGLACFSKYPITDSWTIPYESENNGSCVYKVDVNGKIITIVNNHLETNRITKKDRAEYAEAFNNIEGARGVKTKVFQLADIARQRLGVAFKIRDGQAKLVKEEIDKSNKYIIACGDLNDPPNSYAAYLIKGNKLRDAFADTGLGFRHTYNENKFYFRIDHIFYSPDLKAYNCMVDNKEKYSDHYPMICYFTFKE